MLQVDPESTIDIIKTKYKRLSILVHPDKNQDDKDRAQSAFEGNKYKILKMIHYSFCYTYMKCAKIILFHYKSI